MELLEKINVLSDEDINGLPEVIRHEYCRIIELIKSGENYGARWEKKAQYINLIRKNADRVILMSVQLKNLPIELLDK